MASGSVGVIAEPLSALALDSSRSGINSIFFMINIYEAGCDDARDKPGCPTVFRS